MEKSGASGLIGFLGWYYRTMYVSDRKRLPLSSHEGLDLQTRYRVTLLLFLPAGGLMVLLTPVLMKSGWLPLPGMGVATSVVVLVLALGSGVIYPLYHFVKRLGFGRTFTAADFAVVDSPAERARASRVFWSTFVLALGIPAALVALTR